MAETYTAKWGIMATGGIATSFCKDILKDPSLRDTTGVNHRIVAVSSSNSASRAADFIKKIEGPEDAKTYGSYAELVADPNVEIVYVATPHGHHFQNAMLALQAGKHVLCEKALTVTAAQTKKLVQTAKEKNLFLMEAVWTRFFPLSIKIRELITSGAIGDVHRTFADLSFGNVVDNGKLGFDDGTGKLSTDDSHRMVNADLAGGALLDLGIYSLTWVFQALYHTQPEAEKEKPKVVAAMNIYDTGVDESTTIVCSFPKHRSQGIATTSLLVAHNPDEKGSAGPAIRIQGTKGEIQVIGNAFQPTGYKVIYKDQPGEVEVVECPVPGGRGMAWEADECARCLRDGLKESKTIPLEESIVIMEVMDEALKQGGVKYPELISTDVYDANSPLNTGKH
ncbi:NADP:D-xylose dehydrogenase [Sarocladium strictum]